MPQTALPAIGMAIGGLGSGASAAGGKKASNRANDLAQQQLDLQKGQWRHAKAAWDPAFGYWTDLLKGGQAATQATGPYASLISQSGQGARQSILQNMPRGGERDLAIAQNQNQQYGDISRLYAGMQPAAAGALSQMFGMANPSPNTGAAAGIYGGQMQNAMDSGRGFGGLLYNSAQKKADPTKAPNTIGGGGR